MARSSTTNRKVANKVPKARASKARVSKRSVVISKPASPEHTEKAFGISAQRSRGIKGLVDKVTG